MKRKKRRSKEGSRDNEKRHKDETKKLDNDMRGRKTKAVNPQ